MTKECPAVPADIASSHGNFTALTGDPVPVPVLVLVIQLIRLFLPQLLPCPRLPFLNMFQQVLNGLS
ncbi:MAG: hypothetical protein ACFFD4_22015 [Candidatus Odinarchaeota archaeon]